MAANAGRSKLSTEEFNLGDEDRESSDLSDKYKKHSSSSGGSGYNTTSANDNRSNSFNTNKNNSYSGSSNNTSNNVSNNAGYIASNSASNNNYNSSSNNARNNSYNNSSSNNSYSNSNNSYTSSKPNSFNNYSSTNNPNNLNSSRSGGYSKPPMTYSDIGNNSFDRWNNSNNSITSLGGVESVELLQEQVNHLRREYEGLKQRFSDLSRLRLSEPEEMFEEHKKLSELRDQAAEKTIKTLQKENEQLKKQLTVKNNEKIVESKESQESEEEEEIQESENDFMLQVEKILKIYSSFSGLKITPSPSNPLTEWHCEFSSRSGRFDFQLIYESDLNRYQYIPLENGNDSEGTGAEGRIKNLPQFLASDILITADQMQIFFWRLLDTLSKKQQQQQQQQQ